MRPGSLKEHSMENVYDKNERDCKGPEEHPHN